MSWSPFETSPNAKFGSRAGVFDKDSDVYTSLYVDVLGSWGVEFWSYKENTGPCVLLCSDVPAFHLLLNRKGCYVLSSISTGGKHDVSKLPSRMVRGMDMGSVFDSMDKVILPIPRSGVQGSKVVADFAVVSSVVDTSSLEALLVPFKKPLANFS